MNGIDGQAILNVDDEASSRRTTTTTLERAGFAVVEAATGPEALEKATRGGIDLIVLGGSPPAIDAADVCRRLRADPRWSAVAVVQITPEPSPTDRPPSLELGADAYLSPPVEPRELVATVRSLLRLRRAEDAAKRAAREWQGTFDAIADAVFIVDPTARIERCNRAAARLCAAASPEALVGRDFAASVRDALGPVEVPDATTLRVRGDRATTEAQSGDSFYRITLDPIVGADSRLVGAVGIVVDVTETRRLEEELWRRYVQLVDVDRRKDEFLAMLGHELRNPLAAIQSALDLERLAERDSPAPVPVPAPGLGPAPPPGVPRLRQTVQRQVGHLTRLVNDLLDVSRITRGRIELRKERVDLREVLEHAALAVEPRLAARGHRLVLEVAATPVPVVVDPTRMEQVIANLLDNAIKYSEPGPIEVALEREVEGEAFAVLTVRDYGRGIAPDAIDRIFELFVQVDPSIDRAAGGLGIGLTLVQRLVAMHGGSVAAHSEGLGRGTEFVVRLPLAAIEARDTEPLSANVLPVSRETQPELDRRVLLVDDNDDLREMVRYVLERHGFVVLEASHGAEAVELALRDRPPVALVDIGLPGMDGFEVARRIREQEHAGTPPMRLIAMTGYGTRDDRDRAMDAGFDAHLVKPVESDDLVRAIVADDGSGSAKGNAPVT